MKQKHREGFHQRKPSHQAKSGVRYQHSSGNLSELVTAACNLFFLSRGMQPESWRGVTFGNGSKTNEDGRK